MAARGPQSFVDPTCQFPNTVASKMLSLKEQLPFGSRVRNNLNSWSEGISVVPQPTTCAHEYDSKQLLCWVRHMLSCTGVRGCGWVGDNVACGQLASKGQTARSVANSLQWSTQSWWIKLTCKMWFRELCSCTTYSHRWGKVTSRFWLKLRRASLGNISFVP